MALGEPLQRAGWLKETGGPVPGARAGKAESREKTQRAVLRAHSRGCVCAEKGRPGLPGLETNSRRKAPWEEGASNPSPARRKPAPPDGAPPPGFRPLSTSFCHRPRAEAVSKEPCNCFPPVPGPRTAAERTFPLLPPGWAPEIVTETGVICGPGWVWAGNPESGRCGRPHGPQRARGTPRRTPAPSPGTGGEEAGQVATALNLAPGAPRRPPSHASRLHRAPPTAGRQSALPGCCGPGAPCRPHGSATRDPPPAPPGAPSARGRACARAHECACACERACVCKRVSVHVRACVSVRAGCKAGSKACVHVCVRAHLQVRSHL